MAKTEVTTNPAGNPSSTASVSSGNPGESADGSQPLYPPLTVPEPYVSEKKKAAIASCLKYRQVIDECRARRFSNDVFKPTKYFCPPDLAARKSRVIKKSTKKVPKTDEDSAKEMETDADDTDTPKAKTIAAEDEDAKETQEDEEEDTNVAKSDSDIDDYTANEDFQDDEGGFDDGGMDNENDNHTF